MSYINFRNSRRKYAEYMRRGIVERNQLNFGDALTALKNVDPTGWEQWFDSCDQIPDEINWVDTLAINRYIEIINARTTQVASNHVLAVEALAKCDLFWQSQYSMGVAK